ncbi:MAG: serine/threonine-protein kinase PpkA [Lentisphaeria bacterium]
MGDHKGNTVSPLDFEIPGYDIIEVIGRGGMASVYRARQHSFDRNVAVKILKPDLSEDDAFCQRFVMESLIVAKLSHSNIVQVYDVGEIQNHYFIAMEFLSGGDLHAKLQKGLTTKAAVSIIKQMSSALDFAHRKHIIHRDLKPDNVMFREDGAAVLTDFGIAKETNADINLTQTGLIVGTPKYMSPEQIRGSEPSPEGDIYSLGILFYQLLTNRVPFAGADLMATAYMHFNEPVPLLPPPLARFQTLIEQMLAKDASERMGRGNDVIKALEQLEQRQHRSAPISRDETLAIDGFEGFATTDDEQTRIKSKLHETLINPAAASQPTVANSAKSKSAMEDQETVMLSADTGAKMEVQSDSHRARKDHAVKKRILALSLGGLGAAALLTTLALVITLALLMWPHPQTETIEETGPLSNLAASTREEISRLLEAAADDIAHLRLQKGQSNALSKYQRVLVLEPKHPEALVGMQRIQQTYLDLIESALAKGEADKAQNYLDDLQPLAQSKPLSDLQRRVALALKRHKQTLKLSSMQLMQISALLKGAELNIKEGRIKSPANDNAIDRYQKVLAIDPDNIEAKAKLAEISN